MKNSQITITEIESDQDVQAYRDSTGIVLAVGNFIVQGILNDTPEGIRIFNSASDAEDYVNTKVFSYKPKSTKVNAKAKSKPAKKRGPKPKK